MGQNRSQRQVSDISLQLSTIGETVGSDKVHSRLTFRMKTTRSTGNTSTTGTGTPFPTSKTPRPHRHSCAVTEVGRQKQMYQLIVMSWRTSDELRHVTINSQ